MILGLFAFPKKIEKTKKSSKVQKSLLLGPLICGTSYGYLESGLVALLPILAVQEFKTVPEYCLVTVILAAAASSVFWGTLSDRQGAKKTVILLLAVLGFGSSFFAVSSFFLSPIMTIYLSCVLFGTLAGGLYPVGFSWLLHDLPESQYGYASGAFARAYGLGSLAGPLATGAIAQNWGSHGLFLMMGGLGILGLLLTLKFGEKPFLR